MMTPGFIQHPWTHQRGDSMSAACVIEHIENEAMHGCGLYYEIYHHRVICRLLQLLQTLNGTDRITLTEEANRRGFTLDETSIKESRQCYSNIIREIRESQY
ncbi:hypothetical protein H4F35_04815 [Pectobacterium versatile]|nr:hypothetical protein [Yersinia enterocolitica]EKN6368017.1 hypothetical protein [Yersinia enterocolitica]MBN3059069.1 hypothetical protein [Pectobacterium versatile]